MVYLPPEKKNKTETTLSFLVLNRPFKLAKFH